MAKKSAPSLDVARFDKHVDEHFTISQREFVPLFKDWFVRPRDKIILLSGGPGTGKTYVVQTSLSFVEDAPIAKMAYSARIASEIGGRTIHSYLHLDYREGSVLNRIQKKLAEEMDVEKCLEKSAELKLEIKCFKRPFIVVIDEVGVLPIWFLYWIIVTFFGGETPVLIIIMGDSHQLRPVRSVHNVFTVNCLDERFEMDRVRLVESKRFFPDYAKIVERLRIFVNDEDEEGLETFVRQKFPVVDEIDETILNRCCSALAFRNDTVDLYNQYYIKYMFPGKKVRLYEWNNIKNEPNWTKYLDVKQNCKIYVTENGVSEVTNGTPLLFKQYLPKRDVIECESLRTPGEIIQVKRNLKKKFPITLGFAATVHKYQGFTIDDEAIVINFNQSKNLNLIYTALSRVKAMKQIVAIAM